MAPCLTWQQIAFLANGPQYIPICQSRFSRLPIDQLIEREYERLVETFKAGLNKHCMSAMDARAKEFFNALKNLLCQYYTKPLSSRLLVRARHDYRMMMSIRRVRNKQNLIIQRTDKSKVFHVATAASYHRKSLEYMNKTNAYKLIENNINPCMNHFRQVLALIDPLLKKRAIDLTIWKQYMRPRVDQVELAHLYFLPKPHKVNCCFFLRFLLDQ